MPSPDHARDETDDQKADRRYDELLQELRVAQTGVQFLFAYLLTLAFTQRFARITDFQHGLYVATLMARGGLAMLLLAINGAVLLILDVVLTGALPFVLSGLATAWFVLVWYVVPLTARERGE